MSIIRVELAKEFMLGDDVDLVAMDGDGVTDFAAALRSARQHGRSKLEHNRFHHEFSIEAGQSAVEIDGLRVVWRLDQAKVSELVYALEALEDCGRPSHQYVDIERPTDTWCYRETSTLSSPSCCGPTWRRRVSLRRADGRAAGSVKVVKHPIPASPRVVDVGDTSPARGGPAMVQRVGGTRYELGANIFVAWGKL